MEPHLVKERIRLGYVRVIIGDCLLSCFAAAIAASTHAGEISDNL
jgi:hypothetical protein